MFTPSDDDDVPVPVDARAFVAGLAAKHGVRPLAHTGPMAVLAPEQAAQAREFVQFKSHGADDPETPKRGARILLARTGAMLREKMWGLPDDPADPAAADYSDVKVALDGWAAVIHRPARFRGGGGQHAR